MPRIKPSLFIGLGTSGAEILGHLQELIVQEYLVEGFPVTRLLSFVTEESDGRVLRHASREQVFHLTVPSTQVVRGEITNPATNAGRALAAWLPKEVCVNATQFLNGSNGMRAAGRLQLWRNYNKMREKIAANVLACTSQPSRQAAVEYLRRLNVEDCVVEEGLNIYVVGSLCGGTCSGMFLDMGFILRSLPEIVAAGAAQAVKIIGVFTTLNSAQAQTSAWELPAANCYAVKEFDFCSHMIGAKSFPILFPDGNERPRDHLPYDYFYLLGATSMAGVSLVDGAHQFSHKAVLQMIAHSLFLDSYAGTCDIKEGMRTDWNGHVVPGAPDPRRRNPRALFSFGCAIISYPMYSIARATAGLIAKDICGRWLTPRARNCLDLVEAARKELTQAIFPRLTQPSEAPAIETEMRTEIRRTRGFASLRPEVLRVSLLELPDPANPISQRFQERGHYHATIQSQYDRVVEPQACELVRKFVEQCRTARDCSLPDVFVALAAFRAMLEKERRQNEAARVGPVFDISRLDPGLTRLQAVERDFWLKIMFLKRVASAECREQVRNAFEKLALQALSSLAAEFRGRAIDSALEELTTVEGRLRSEERMIRELADPNSQGAGYLTKQSGDITDSLRSPPRNVIPVWSAPEGNVEMELELQRARVVADEAERSMMNAVSKSNGHFTLEWTRDIIGWRSSEELGTKMLDALTITILRRMRAGNVSVLDRAVERCDDVKHVINYASPYMEFTQEYLEGAGNRLPPPHLWTKNAVFGDATEDGALEIRLQNRLLPLPRQDGIWGCHALQGLSHYLVFYQEEAYFSTTYLAAFEGYERAFRNHRDNMRGGSPVLRWTDHRWHPHGPPIGDMDRAKYIGFLLENALEVLTGARVSGEEAGGDSNDQLFGWLVEDGRRIYYFERPCQHGISDRVYVGRDDDYLNMARRETAKRFIPYLVEKLSAVVRSLGPTPRESLDKFRSKCMVVKRRLDLDRDEGLRAEDWAQPQDEAYRDRGTRLDAFFIHVRGLTWPDQVPSDEERQILRQFSWLIDWAREDY